MARVREEPLEAQKARSATRDHKGAKLEAIKPRNYHKCVCPFCALVMSFLAGLKCVKGRSCSIFR